MLICMADWAETRTPIRCQHLNGSAPSTISDSLFRCAIRLYDAVRSSQCLDITYTVLCLWLGLYTTTERRDTGGYWANGRFSCLVRPSSCGWMNFLGARIGLVDVYSFLYTSGCSRLRTPCRPMSHA